MAILIMIFLVIPLYIIDEYFAKKYVMETEKHSALKLICWMCFVAALISGLVYLFGLNESGKGPVTTLLENPNMFMLMAVYPLSLFFAFLAYKYLNLAQVIPIVYGNSVIILMSQTIYRIVNNDIEGLRSLLSLEKILVMCLAMAGYVLLCCLALCKDEDNQEKKHNYRPLIGLIFALISLSFSGIETTLDNQFSASNTLGTFDYIGAYYFLGAVICLIIWVLIWILEKKPYNLFNMKKEQNAFWCTVTEVIASGLFLVAASYNENIAQIFLPIVPLTILLLSKKLFSEKFKIEEFMGIIMLIVSVTLLDIINLLG